MMLSPQAARMGTVHTTLRKIGLHGSRRAYGGGGSLSTSSSSSSSFLGLSPWKSATNNSIKSGLSKNQLFVRFKSSRAAAATVNYEDSDDDEGYTNINNNPLIDGARYRSYAGHAAAMEQRASTVATTDEPWMINLGRNNDNEWLMRPRDPEEWFTGVAPTHQCPGTFALLLAVRVSMHVSRWVFLLFLLVDCLYGTQT